MNLSNPLNIPRIIILTPVYNEEENLPRYVAEVSEILLNRNDYNFHVLFIDDGSSDQSWRVISDICNKNEQFQAIRLSRNYGSHIAISAGFAHAEGDAITILACDLQDPPEIILEFLKKWHSGAKIVWGRRRNRKDCWWRILTSNLFYKIIRNHAMPQESKFTTGSFLLADKKVVECFRHFPERNRITFALVAWTGFNQAVVDYDRKQRVAGSSGWSFMQMIKAMYDTFIGFSMFPIRMMTALGIGISFFSLMFGTYPVFLWLIGNPKVGWASQMFALSFFFGIEFLLMGVVGEYLYRIYSEVVRRPLYFVSDTTKPFEDKMVMDECTREEKQP